MINPFLDSITELSDSQIEEHLQQLSKKYFAAHRLGKPELLTQLQNFITIYKDERARRAFASKKQLDNDLEQLINVD